MGCRGWDPPGWEEEASLKPQWPRESIILYWAQGFPVTSDFDLSSKTTASYIISCSSLCEFFHLDDLFTDIEFDSPLLSHPFLSSNTCLGNGYINICCMHINDSYIFFMDCSLCQYMETSTLRFILVWSLLCTYGFLLLLILDVC